MVGHTQLWQKHRDPYILQNAHHHFLIRHCSTRTRCTLDQFPQFYLSHLSDASSWQARRGSLEAIAEAAREPASQRHSRHRRTCRAGVIFLRRSSIVRSCGCARWARRRCRRREPPRSRRARRRWGPATSLGRAWWSCPRCPLARKPYSARLISRSVTVSASPCRTKKGGFTWPNKSAEEFRASV